MKANLHLVFSIAIFLVCFSGWSQKNHWKLIEEQPKTIQGNAISKAVFYQLNEASFIEELSPIKKSVSTSKTINIPGENGEIVSYDVIETPILHPELARKYPKIKSYSGWSVDGKKKLRLSISHNGIQAMVRNLTDNQNVFIQKEKGAINSYKWYKGAGRNSSFECKTPQNIGKPAGSISTFNKLVDDQTLRKYRVAISASGDYTEYHGGAVADALAAINATLTRVNEVFETDLGITLELIANTDLVIFIDGDTDPYSTGSALLGQVQNELSNTIGNENFDIGHLFHVDNDNGNAGGIGTVCTSLKGRAFSSANNPETDLFDLDYVAHEMGHQFGANHTWSFEAEGTGVQAEPASGTTIMGYAGIVETNNVAANGDDYFHYYSIQQITDYVRTLSCSENTALTNNVPVINSIPDFMIPVGTAFVLSASATDADTADELTYAWEQIDDGVVTATTFGPENPIGANFRSLPPSSDGFRYFPRLSRVLEGTITQSFPEEGSAWETIATIGREMNFAVTVRDNALGGGQVASEQVKVDIIDAAGPFSVSSQATSESYVAGSVIDVIWNVASTDQAPINAENVDIFLSIDGGLTFPFTLASDLPNLGLAKVQLPGLEADTNSARLMVKASNNIFYAVNQSDFEITATEVVLNFSTLIFDVCQPDDLDITFVYESYLGFTDTTTFTADVPSEISSTFSPSTASADNTSVTLSLTNLTALNVGSYDLLVNADLGASSIAVPLVLNIYDSNFEDVVLNFPEDAATDVLVNTNFEWQPQLNADAFDIEIALDAAFSNIIESATVHRPSYEALVLSPQTEYFWRVSPRNDCGTGSFGTAFSFTTNPIDCEEFFSENLPIAISSGPPSTISSIITVNQDLPLDEVEVNLNVEHAFLSDLVISLSSPAGTKVVLVSNTCGSLNDINAIFDDDGVPIVCSGAPAISDIVQPLGMLSAFEGESTLGDWVLEIEDTASGDGGNLNDFSIVFCVEGLFRPDEDGDGVFDDGVDLCLGTPKGVEVDTNGCQVYRFAQENFSIEVNSESCRENNDGFVVVTANDLRLDYQANLTGNGVDVTQPFTETVQFDALAAGTYVLCISGTDGTNEYEPSCFNIEVLQPEELSVFATLNQEDFTATLQLNGASLYNVELNGVTTQTRDTEITLALSNGLNSLRVSTNLPCQGEFKDAFLVDFGSAVFPNPTLNETTVYLQDFVGKYQLQLYAYDGRLIISESGTTQNGTIPVNLKQVPSGLYFIKIGGDAIQRTFKVIRR